MGIRINSTKVFHMVGPAGGGAAILTIQWDKGKAKMIT
jgi:hypothetical protein